jgi:hypothetical protein
MNSRQIERAAYIAAHRLLTMDLSEPELACPGARRSALLDNMASVIKNVYEATATPRPKTAAHSRSYPNLVPMNTAKRAAGL